MRHVLALTLIVTLAEPALAQAPPPPAPPPPRPPAPVVAPDGSALSQAPLFCIVTTAHTCAGQTCTKADSFGDLKFPAKLLVHFDSKVVASTNAEGFPHVSQIASLARTGGDYVLQGADHGAGWMIQLDEAGTKMTFAVTSSSTVLVASGTCKRPG